MTLSMGPETQLIADKQSAQIATVLGRDISQYVPSVAPIDSEECWRELANVPAKVYMTDLHIEAEQTLLAGSQAACSRLFIPTQ